MVHLEGRQSVLAALQARQRRIHAVLLRRGLHEDKVRDLLTLAEQRGVPVRFVERAEIDECVHGGTHGGVLALCSPKPRMTAASLLQMAESLREPPLLLLLEGVDDARNLGFILRTAEAMGAHAVLLKKHLWDFDEAEVARPASGAYERIALAQFEGVDLLKQLRRGGFRLIGCLAKARRTIHAVDLNGPLVLALGGEKRGLSGAVRGVCDGFVTIPTRGGATSLSLSHAAAIALAEAARQRAAHGKEPESD